MNRIQILILITMAAVFATTPALFGQQMPSEAPSDQGNKSDNRSGHDDIGLSRQREEVRKKIEAVRIWRLTEELKLDANTVPKLSALLSSLDQERKKAMGRQMEAMRDLRSFLQSAKPDEAKISVALEKLEKSRHEMQELREKEMKGLKEILSIEQQARYLIFQREFMKDMRSMIAGAHGNRPGNRGNRAAHEMRGEEK